MKEDFTDFIELSGLLEYDSDTIQNLSKNPKRLLKRLWQTHSIRLYSSISWDKLTGRLKEHKQDLEQN